MYLDRRKLTDPSENGLFAVLALSISLFAFAYSKHFGPVLILAFYAMWLPLLALDPGRVLDRMSRAAWLTPFALFACLSVLWSAAPAVSGRGAVQYATCILCAVIAARVVSTRSLTMGGALGATLVVLYSLAFGRSSYDPLDGTLTFVGVFSSKNQLGLFASLGVAFALARLMLAPASRSTKLTLLMFAGVNLAALAASHSGTSLVSLLVLTATLLALRPLKALTPRMRILGVLGFGSLGIAGLYTTFALGGFDAALAALGKDETLTGRTYLWSEAIRLGAEDPLLGVGYLAWWIPGFAEAERLWSEFYINSRSGFHFHNTFLQIYVDLGLVGLALFILTYLTALASSLRALVVSSDPWPVIDVAILLMFLVRAFAEVDTMQPYTIGTFLLYMAAARVTLYSASTATRRIVPEGAYQPEFPWRGIGAAPHSSSQS